MISMREHRSNRYKSIAYSLSFRAKDRNLEDADITGAMDRIVKALEHVGAELLRIENRGRKDFIGDLPQELIAQDPLEDRSSSRLMVLDKNTVKWTHRVFKDITGII